MLIKIAYNLLKNQKIKEMPKFKLNFNKLNNLSNSVEENMSNDKIIQNNNKNMIKKYQLKYQFITKSFIIQQVIIK